MRALLIIVMLGYFSQSVASDDSRKQKKTSILNCAREIYDVSDIRYTGANDIQRLAEMLTETFRDNSNLETLLADCQALLSNHQSENLSDNERILNFNASEMDMTSSREEKARYWKSRLSTKTHGENILLGIVNPGDAECNFDKALIPIVAYQQYCRAKNGYAYYKIKAGAGITLPAGCFAVGIGGHIKVYQTGKLTDWSLVLR